jgi:hypothetical protein
VTSFLSDAGIPMTNVTEPRPPPEAVLSVRLPVSRLTHPVVYPTCLICFASFSYLPANFVQRPFLLLSWLSQSTSI